MNIFIMESHINLFYFLLIINYLLFKYNIILIILFAKQFLFLFKKEEKESL